MKRSLTLQIFDEISKKFRTNDGEAVSESSSDSESEDVFFNPNNFLEETPAGDINADTDEDNAPMVSRCRRDCEIIIYYCVNINRGLFFL